MKVAVCFSGQPRYLEVQYEKISDTFIRPYHADVFVHCWWDPSYAGQRFDYSPHASKRTGIWAPDTDRLIKDMYAPLQMEAEPQKEFDMSDLEGANFERQAPHITKSMWYSIFRANELRREYEKQNQMEYDWVIRCRFDLSIESFDLNLHQLDPKKLYVSGELKPALNDQCAIASPQVMDDYCNLYNRIAPYFKEDQLPSLVNEKLLSHHVEKLGIPVYYCSQEEMRVNVTKIGQERKHNLIERMIRRVRGKK